MEDDAKRKRKPQIDLKRINEHFGPFCHGTSSYWAEQIDREGLKPRKWRRQIRESMWEADLVSKEDRVYLASVRQNPLRCIEAMEHATEEMEVGEVDWINGVFYVLESIPEEYKDKLTIDEDCKQMVRMASQCRTAQDSLSLIGSLGIKQRISRDKLQKMTPREFYKYMQKYNPDLPKWREFITERIQQQSGPLGVEWMKEHFPQLFEE